MSGIKSLADELREAMRNPAAATPKPAEKKRPPPAPRNGKKAVSRPSGEITADEDLSGLFSSIKSHQPGHENILIRLAPNTVRLLKQLKIIQSIEVNKFISFALHEYLKGNPALINYIKESLNQFDL